jgi:amidase
MEPTTTDVPGRLGGLPATELAALVRSGAADPVEATEAAFGRIAALDRGLGAFVAVRWEQALAEAAALARRPDLDRLPLAGVPVAVKDSMDVAGEPTRSGSRATSNTPPAADSELVARLRAAGAVVVGRTAMPELGIWPVTESARHGVTRNPWDQTLTPGGSSGGAAVAVAAGMVPVALGADGGGSIRIPAACCGLVGFKPGRGVIPSGRPEPWFGLVASGPLTTTVADAALLLDVLAGTERYRDPRPPDGPLRVAYSTRTYVPGLRPAAGPVAAAEAVAGLLAASGHVVDEADPPYPAGFAATFLRRWLVGVARDAAHLDRSALEARTRAQARLGTALDRVRAPGPEPVEAWRARAAAWFADGFDVLLTPALGRAPVEAGRWAGRGLTRTLAGATAFAPCTAPWNVAGFPSLAVPAPLGGDGTKLEAGGVPVGALLTGPPGSEDVLLGLAAQLEASAPWPRPAPGY